MRPRAATTLLLSILALALLHALFQARVRPLYQVSDEIAYLYSAQVFAFEGAPVEVRRCITPPDGKLLALGEGGKRGFRAVAGWQLRALCASGNGTLPLFWLRALQALSLPGIALAAWYLARLLSGSTVAGLIAALAVAVHPVAAKYAGGVTPDAWANAFSAAAIVAGARMMLGAHGWWDPLLLGVSTVAALLWKDTTYVLVFHAFLVLAALAGGWVVLVVSGGRAMPWKAIAVVLSLATAAILVRHQWSAWFESSSPAVLLGAAATRHVDGTPAELAAAVVRDAAAHAIGIVDSSLRSLYRPLVYARTGWTLDTAQPLTPMVPVVTALVSLGVGAVGFVRALVRPATDRRGLSRVVLTVWLLTGLACLLQPSIRQVLLQSSDLHQGRWLFPVLAPAAAVVGIGVREMAGTDARRVMLLAIAWTTSLWLVVLDIVRHYYAAFPGTLTRGVLFVRPTGDVETADARIHALIESTTAAQSSWVTWSILVGLVLASLYVAVGFSSLAASRPPHA